MTKAQRADALLRLARQWQNDQAADGGSEFLDELDLWNEDSFLFGTFPSWAGMALSEAAALGYDPFPSWAGMALSEAAALGYDLVQADGSEDES